MPSCDLQPVFIPKSGWGHVPVRSWQGAQEMSQYSVAECAGKPAGRSLDGTASFCTRPYIYRYTHGNSRFGWYYVLTVFGIIASVLHVGRNIYGFVEEFNV